MTIQPLVPVEGGVVDPEDLVGRAVELRRLVAAVARGGAYVVGDRRMGKTSLLRKAQAELEADGHIVLYVSAETDSIDTFVGSLLQTIRSQPAFKDRWAHWTREFAGEVKVGILGQGLTLKGKIAEGAKIERDLLSLCAHAAESAGAGSVVLMVDEIAQLAQLVGEAHAAELLRTLRRARQSPGPRVSVVLAGSVGLHHVVGDSTVLNDLPRVFVGPLNEGDARLLARRLVLGELGYDDDGFAAEVARACSDIPYYIQRLVAAYGLAAPLGAERSAPEELVARAVEVNDWETDHYLTRLPKYFGPLADLAVHLLDDLSAGSMTVDALHSSAGSRFYEAPPARATVADTLDKLRLDHYLSYADDSYVFSSEFLRGAWISVRRRLG